MSAVFEIICYIYVHRYCSAGGLVQFLLLSLRGRHRSQRPRGLRRGSVVARFLGLRVRNPPET